MRQNRQAEDQRKYNLAQAEMTRYSPWTGQKGQLDTRDIGSPLEAGVGGAVQGLGITQSLGGELPWFSGGSSNAVAPGSPSSLGISLGGQEIAQGLEQRFNQQMPNIFRSQKPMQNLGLSLANNISPYGF